MGFGGIIFDFNGTLFKDSDKQEKSWGLFSKKLRGYPLSDDEMLNVMHGRTNRSVIEYLTGEPVSEERLTELVCEKEKMYRDMCLEDSANLKLTPGAVELLGFLCEKGIPCTIATASEVTNVKFFIEVFGLGRWFDPDKIVYDDGLIPGKPEPDIYLKAAEEIGLRPEQCIVVEDAPAGMEAARRAGIGRIIAIGSREKHRFLGRINGVSQVICDFTEFSRDMFL